MKSSYSVWKQTKWPRNSNKEQWMPWRISPTKARYCGWNTQRSRNLKIHKGIKECFRSSSFATSSRLTVQLMFPSLAMEHLIMVDHVLSRFPLRINYVRALPLHFHSKSRQDCICCSGDLGPLLSLLNSPTLDKDSPCKKTLLAFSLSHHTTSPLVFSSQIFFFLHFKVSMILSSFGNGCQFLWKILLTLWNRGPVFSPVVESFTISRFGQLVWSGTSKRGEGRYRERERVCLGILLCPCTIVTRGAKGRGDFHMKIEFPFHDSRRYWRLCMARLRQSKFHSSYCKLIHGVCTCVLHSCTNVQDAK